MNNIKDQENLNQKKVLLRLDLNVPFKDGLISDETRINKIIPVLDFLIKKKSNIIIKPRHRKERPEAMIRRFIKKTKKERIVDEIRDRQRYKKPSVKKKIKRERAERARQREARKRLRALERRRRKN